MSQTAEEVYEVVRRYILAWKDGDWDRLRSVLSPDVIFEDPHLGTIAGIDNHISIYVNHTRYPNLDEVILVRLLSNVDGALASYDVYLSGRRYTTFEQVDVRDGLITRIVAATVEWPSPSGQ